LNLASALLKQILELQDFETWGSVRKHYLPAEYHSLYTQIERHSDTYHQLPTIEDLKLSIRDAQTRDKVYAIESLEVDAEPYMLLEYLKNEYTQREILGSLETYIDESVSFESAEESLGHLHQIVMDVEDKVELETPQDSMQRITLFEDESDLARYLPLGLNTEYDNEIQFSPIDLILVGGQRGSGKSITCANITNSVYNSGKSAIYFTIEMDSRQTLQRVCSVATSIPFSRLRLKNLSVVEWEKVAKWWADRFLESKPLFAEYKDHRDFDAFHSKLTTTCVIDPVRQIDVVYDPSLTVAKIRTEIDKKIKSDMDLGVIVVDYLNQVKRSAMPSRSGGQYDWTEQIEVSKALKSMAQEYEVPIFSPYQTDAGGEARFAKGILDAADAAFSIDAHAPEDNCMSFTCVKMRNASMRSFTSEMNWETLQIGPETALSPKEREASEHKTGESIDDLD
jgi:replicative DNA helicase